MTQQIRKYLVKHKNNNNKQAQRTTTSTAIKQTNSSSVTEVATMAAIKYFQRKCFSFPKPSGG